MGLIINVVLKRTDQNKLIGIKSKIMQLTGSSPTVVSTGSDPTADARNNTYNQQPTFQSPNVQPEQQPGNQR